MTYYTEATLYTKPILYISLNTLMTIELLGQKEMIEMMLLKKLKWSKIMMSRSLMPSEETLIAGLIVNFLEYQYSITCEVECVNEGEKDG